MAYSIRPHRAFERPFLKLSRTVKEDVVRKLEFLAAHPDTLGAPMGNLPKDLRGLYKNRVGDHRLFFWVDHQKQEIVPYDINRRDKAYRDLWKR